MDGLLMMLGSFFGGLSRSSAMRRPLRSVSRWQRGLCAKREETKSSFFSTGTASGRSPVSWAGLWVAGVFGVAALKYYMSEKQRLLDEAQKKATRQIGKPLLGGPWTLVSQDGVPVTDASLVDGKHTHSLLYFGFTYCPDICPAELIKMGQIIDMLDKDPQIGKVVRPVFISVDPKRDGVAQVKHYIKDFHPRMLGLTGTPKQVEHACKQYRVYHSVADQAEEDEDDYLVDHSIVMYLIGPDGLFIDFYTQLTEPEEAYERIKKHILEGKEEQQ